MKQQMPEIKRHFKMYKSGKLWLVAGITAASLMVGGQAASAADNVQPEQPTASTVQDQPKTEGQTNQKDQANSGATTPTPDKSGTQTSGANSGATSGSTTTDQGNKTDGNKDANQPAKDDGTTKETVDGGNVLVTTKDGQVSLQDKDGKPVSGVKTINGKTYSFDAQGKAQTGLKTIDGKTYNFGTNGVAQTGVFTLDGKTYSFGTDGVAQTGLQTVDGKVYDFDEKTAVAKTGWQVIKDSKFYFDEKTGVAKTGWQTIGDNKYYFDTKTGVAYVGWHGIDGKLEFFTKDGINVKYLNVPGNLTLVTYGNKKIALLDQSGNNVTGWQTINGQKYYFGKDGYALTGQQTIDNKLYFFNTDGTAALDKKLNIGNFLYFFGKDGAAQTGFVELTENKVQQKYYFGPKDYKAVKGLQQIDGKTYYFDPETYQMWRNKTLTLGAATYSFDANGIATQTGQVVLDRKGDLRKGKDGQWYLFESKDSNAKALTGWQKLADGRVVYFDANSKAHKNAMAHGELNIDGCWYFFEDNGQVAKGWKTLADGRVVYYDVDDNANGQGMIHGLSENLKKDGKVGNYYFDLIDGRMRSGLISANGKIYYFAPTMLVNQEKYLNNAWRYFGADGAMATGFVQLKDNRTVYYNAKGEMQYGEKNINGQWYLFDTWDGHMYSGWTKLKDGRVVYYDVNPDGTGRGMLHGVQTVKENGKDVTYYFDTWDGAKKSGVFYNSTTKQLNFFDQAKNGALLQDGTAKLGNKTVQAAKDGSLVMKDGEQAFNGNWYLYDAKTKQVVVGLTKLADGRTVYYDPKTAVMYHGEKNIDGHWYYFDNWDGHMAKGLTRLPDGRMVLYNNQGQMLYGEQYVNGGWRYFDKVTGKMVTGWYTLPDKRTVYYANDGKMIHGFTKINGWLVHFDEVNGSLTRYAYVWYNGQRYYARPDGGLTRA